MIRNSINALSRHLAHSTAAYEQTDAPIPQPKRSWLVLLFTVMLGLIIIDSFRWTFSNKYVAFAFEMLIFTAFISVIGVLLFIVIPALYN